MSVEVISAAPENPLPMAEMLLTAQIPDRIISGLTVMEQNLIYAVRKVIDDKNISWRNEECQKVV